MCVYQGSKTLFIWKRLQFLGSPWASEILVAGLESFCITVREYTWLVYSSAFISSIGHYTISCLNTAPNKLAKYTQHMIHEVPHCIHRTRTV
jgi:hypothetical protein